MCSTPEIDARCLPVAFLDRPFPLHNGEALRLAGRLIVFTSGLMPFLLAATGIMIW